MLTLTFFVVVVLNFAGIFVLTVLLSLLRFLSLPRTEVVEIFLNQLSVLMPLLLEYS